MNITIFKSEAAAAPVSKSDLRSQRSAVRKLERTLEKEKRLLTRLEERYAKQNPGAGVTPTAPRPSASATPESDLTGIRRPELIKLLLESRKLKDRADARGKTIGELRALFLKKRKPRTPRSAPKPASNAPSTSSTSPPKGAKLADFRKFDPSMEGPEWQNFINGSAKAPRAKIEGYWRPQRSIGIKDKFPFPIKYDVPGFDKKAFLAALTAAQKKAKMTHSKGSSEHRWTSQPNGASTYHYNGWSWPEGYINYIRAGVPPTQAFYTFLTGKKLATLPKYPRTAKS